MSGDGVLPVIGPLAPAPYVPVSLGRCGCDGEAQSCSRCDGSARDGSAVALAMAAYRRQHPTPTETTGDAA